MKRKAFLLICLIILASNNLSFAAGLEKISLLKTIFQLVFYILMFALVIFVTIFGTKLIARNYKINLASKNMDIIDTLNIPGGIKLIIVKIMNKVYILSLSATNTTVIDILSKEEFDKFSDSFDALMEKHNNRIGKIQSDGKFNEIISSIINKKNKEE